MLTLNGLGDSMPPPGFAGFLTECSCMLSVNMMLWGAPARSAMREPSSNHSSQTSHCRGQGRGKLRSQFFFAISCNLSQFIACISPLLLAFLCCQCAAIPCCLLFFRPNAQQLFREGDYQGWHWTAPCKAAAQSCTVRKSRKNSSKWTFKCCIPCGTPLPLPLTVRPLPVLVRVRQGGRVPSRAVGGAFLAHPHNYPPPPLQTRSSHHGVMPNPPPPRTAPRVLEHFD